MNTDLPHTHPSLPSGQHGAVLIVVLLFLTLIILAGVIAVRNSSTDLKLATSDQINTVLLQSSDSVNNKIEMSVNSFPTNEQYKQIMGITGIFGYYFLGNNDEDIIDFCYRPRSAFFNIDDAVIRRGSGKIVNNTADNTIGYCDPTKSADYTSNRNTTMTQVMIKNVNATANNGAFSQMTLGSDSEEKTAKTNTFDIYSTSVLPAYGSANDKKVKECFAKNASDNEDGVTKCMTDNNIPSKMLVEQVEVANIQSSDYCTYFGDSTKIGSSNALCKDS